MFGYSVRFCHISANNYFVNSSATLFSKKFKQITHFRNLYESSSQAKRINRLGSGLTNIANIYRNYNSLSEKEIKCTGFTNKAKGIFEEHVEDIRKCEDDVSKFKLAHVAVKKVLLDDSISLGSSILNERNDKLLDYNMNGGRCNRFRIFLNTYRNTAPSSKLSDEHILRASIMGYLIEMHLSCYVILDDILDDSEKRRNKICWHKMVGSAASTDVLLMCNAAYVAMQNFFEEESYYIPCFKLFNEVFWATSSALSLDFCFAFDILGKNRKNCSIDVYNDIAVGGIGSNGFLLPILTAMYMTNYNFDRKPLLKIFDLMGYYGKFENDYNDRYGKTTGKVLDEDIRLGKLTWLLLTTLQQSNNHQKTIIMNCYGKNDDVSVKSVVDVYQELEIQRQCLSHKKEVMNSINKEIMNINDTNIQKILFSALCMVENWYKDV